MLSMMTDGLFYELGLVFRPPTIQVDDTLSTPWFRCEWNDLRLPPQRGMDDQSVLVNDTVERPRLLNIKGEEAVESGKRVGMRHHRQVVPGHRAAGRAEHLGFARICRACALSHHPARRRSARQSIALRAVHSSLAGFQPRHRRQPGGRQLSQTSSSRSCEALLAKEISVQDCIVDPPSDSGAACPRQR